MPKENQEKFYEVLFVQLVISLHEAAMLQLGKSANPATGQAEVDLEQAQGTIDILCMLQAKTRGNLGEDEQRLIDQSILSLRAHLAGEVERLNPEPGPEESPRYPDRRPEQAN